MVEQFIKRAFKIRDAAHIEHWKTTSYAAHMALGDFYEAEIDLIDKYVEAHQGAFGVIEDVEDTPKDIAGMINEEIVWLSENREDITQGVSALENIIDEISGMHMKTLYKLENLR